MIAKIYKGVANGTIKAPTSKSMAHRLLICAGLSKGTSIIKDIEYGEDILATLDCLKLMGAQIKKDDTKVTITGVSPYDLTDTKLFNCRESGSTIRFFIPILLLSNITQSFTGKGRLMQRPMTVYENICKEKNLYFEQTDDILSVSGSLTGGTYTVKGNISSQFISGLLFSLPLCETDSKIKILPPLESKSYINMTIDAMKRFGVIVSWEDEYTLSIKGKQQYNFYEGYVEGDYSGSAFLDALSIVGGNVKTTGLLEDSLQGDKIYKEYFKKIEEGCPVLDVTDCPDLAPILMTVAAQKNGCTLTGTYRLKLKESDRGKVMTEELEKFGAQITQLENSIIIKKSELHTPAQLLNGHNDHRIVMSLAVLSTVYGGEITDSQAVAKSFPDFFNSLKKLGIEVEQYGNK